MDNTHNRLVIFGYGNPSRGDDALGTELLRLLQTILPSESPINFIEDFQLHIEHSLDLENQDLALFIDADVSCLAPFTFTQLSPKRDSVYTTHSLHPASVLQVYEQIHQQPSPPAFLLCIRGEHFELGEPLSQSAASNLSAAFEFAKQLCHRIELSAWQSLSRPAPDPLSKTP